jgi:hypothetical protein
VQEVFVTIDDEGRAVVEVKGVKGKGCVELTREIEEALGRRTGNVLTTEYHQQQQQGAANARNSAGR